MHKYLVTIQYPNARIYDIVEITFKDMYHVIKTIIKSARNAEQRVRVIVDDYVTHEEVFHAYTRYSDISNAWIARIGSIGYFKGTDGIDF